MASSGMRPALAGMAISAFLIFASSAAAREPARLPPPVRSALAAAGIPAASAALYVQEVGARTPALAHNAAVPMNPASTMKLVTTLRGAGAARTRLHVEDRGLAQARSAGRARGRPDPARPRRSQADAGELLDAAARAARARPARDPRRRGARPQLLRAGSTIRGQFDDEPSAPYNVGPDALLVNFKALALPLRAGPGAAAVRVIRRAALPGSSSKSSRSIGPARRPCATGVADLKADSSRRRRARASFTRQLSRAAASATLNVALLSHRGLRRRRVPRSCGSEMGGTLERRRARRRAAAGARLLYIARVRAAVRGRARHQQVLQQRHGAPAVPHARRGGSAARRRAPKQRVRAVAQWLAVQGHRRAGARCWRTARAFRATSASARRTLAALLQAAWRSPVMPEFVVFAAGRRRRRHDAQAPARRGVAGRRTSRPAC